MPKAAMIPHRLTRIARGLALATACVSAPAAGANVIVALRPQAAPTGSLLTLADIADVRSLDPAEEERFSSILLEPAPAAGRELRISYDAVRTRLLAAGVDLGEVEFSGATTVVVRGAVATTGEGANSRGDVLQRADEIRRAAEESIQRYLATRPEAADLEIELNLSEAQTAFLAAAAERGCDVIGGAPPWRGEQTFTLRFLDDAERLREVRVTAVLTPRPVVLAAKQALPRGHVIRPDDLVWTKAATPPDGLCATDPRQLVGRETRLPVRTGQPIPLDAIRALPLVRSGQFVTVSSQRPGLNVQRVMKARGDGGAGEIISLQTLEDHKTVLARVTGLQEAEVVDAGAGPAAPLAKAIELEAVPRGEKRQRAPIRLVQESGGPILPVLHETAPEMSPASVKRQAPCALANPIHPQTVSR